MPPRDPEFGPEVGSDLLTIPCYLAKGYDDPGFLRWRQDHPDWFVAGTWTSAPSAAETPPTHSAPGPGAADPAPSQALTTPADHRDRILAATRALVGKGRTIPPFDPSTISLADFHAVAAQAQGATTPNSGVSASQLRSGSEQSSDSHVFHIPDGTSARDTRSSAFSPPENRPGQVETVAHTNPAGGVPLVLNDGTLVLDRLGNPMLVPPGVDLNRNLEGGRFLSHESTLERLGTLGAILRPGGRMDYQRTYGSGSGDPLFNDINRSYIAFGNFNYGAMTAAAGLSLETAEYFAGLANVMGGDRSGPYGTNPTTLPFIIQGYEAYQDGLVGRK